MNTGTKITLTVIGSAVLLGGIIALLRYGLLSDRELELLLISVLTIATGGYAILVYTTLRQGREQRIQPVVTADLILWGKTGTAAGIRIMNGGSGPALNVKITVISEPKDAAFHISILNGVKEGLPVLAAGDSRILSNGQSYQALASRAGEGYQLEISYSSLNGNSYNHVYTVRPCEDKHWLTTSLPYHTQD